MRIHPTRSGARPSANERRIIGPFSPEFGLREWPLRFAPAVNLAWTSANDPLALPFRLNEGVVVTRLGWLNGSTITSSNFDLGIYSTAWARLVSTGSTARSGGSAWQWVDIADTPLAPGDYYLVGVGDTNTTGRPGGVTTVAAPSLALLGAQDSTTDAFPLPNPLTNMAAAATFTIIPWLAMECTGTFSPASSPYSRLPSTWLPRGIYESAGGMGTGGSFPNTLANQAIFLPVSFDTHATIHSLSFAATNGTGNYDIGIYDAGFRRLAASGSTAMTAAGVKTLSFPDMHFKAGETIYLAGAWSSTSARLICHQLASLPVVIAQGCAEEASALPLPSTATPVIPANATNLPLFTLGVR